MPPRPTRPPDQLALFQGTPDTRSRLERALAALNLQAALADAPPDWLRPLKDMAWALEGHSPGSVDPERLAHIHQPGWPAPLEHTWQRLMGRALDGHGIPGVFHGEPAAAFLLRGGEEVRAEASIRRHLFHHPRDTHAWCVLAHFEPAWGAARCAWHGGPLLDGAARAAAAVRADGLSPPGDWLLVYAWFIGDLSMEQVRETLACEGSDEQARLPLAGQGRTFTTYVVQAEALRAAGGDPSSLLEALERISPPAARRYARRRE